MGTSELSLKPDEILGGNTRGVTLQQGGILFRGACCSFV